MSIKIGNNILAKSSTYHPDLFDVKWSDHIINNISWLRADTFSWHSGELYNKAYEHLVEDWNNSELSEEAIPGLTSFKVRVAPDGHKMVSTTNDGPERVQEVFEATGIAWYYIIDLVNHRFKLPRTKFAFEGVRTAVGNYIEPGLPNITGSILDTGSGGEISYESGALYGATIPSSHRVTHVNDSNSTVGIGIDASRSSAIYGSSDTVQSSATEMYLYFYVGNFAQNDLENVAGGIQDRDTAVNYDNITNCITKIPQDIKLELNDGTLTLKAGSKVYYPDGFESDGTTKKFGCRVIEQDYSISSTGGSGTCMICITSEETDGSTATSSILKCLSGDNITPIEYSICYDTATNIITRYGENLAVNIPKASFPLAIVQQVDGVHTSIDQVFNGFGFIGDEFYVLPCVKCLMPNGRNEDGSLKNIEFTTTRVDVCHDADRKDPMILSQYHKPFFLQSDGYLTYTNWYWQQKDKPTFSDNSDSTNRELNYWYNTEANQIWYHRAGVTEIHQCACVGQYLMTSNGITDFRPKQVFRAEDYNESNEHRVIDFMKPTSANNYIWYRKYADGWVEQGGQHLWNKTCPNRVSITYPIPMANAVNALFITRPKGIGDVQAYDGDGCESQTATGFISAGLSSGNSAANSFVWQVSGMAA